MWTTSVVYIFLSFITGTGIVCSINILGRMMKHNRISDTVYDVSELYRNTKYPERLLQWSLKGAFFRKALCWYLEKRFNSLIRNMPEEKRKYHLVELGTDYMLRDIAIRRRDNPTGLVRAFLSTFFDQIEIFLRNPHTEYLEKEPLVEYSPLDLPSDHKFKFTMLKPKKEKRVKVDPYAFNFLGKKHYYLALRQGGDDE